MFTPAAAARRILNKKPVMTLDFLNAHGMNTVVVAGTSIVYPVFP